MRKQCDFSHTKRAKNVPHLAMPRGQLVDKTRVDLWLDDEVVDASFARAAAQGISRQAAINAALRAYLFPESVPVTLRAFRKVLRRILREERQRAAVGKQRCASGRKS